MTPPASKGSSYGPPEFISDRTFIRRCRMIVFILDFEVHELLVKLYHLLKKDYRVNNEGNLKFLEILRIPEPLSTTTLRSLFNRRACTLLFLKLIFQDARPY